MITRFLHELRHRHVLKTAAGYALVAAAAVEFVDILSGAMNLSDAVLRVAIMVALAGLPLIIVLAWFFDLTPQGVVRGQPVPSPGTRKPSLLGSWLLVAVLGSAVVYLGFRLQSEMTVGEQLRAASELLHGKSIAVLPLTNIVAATEPDSTYFSDGIAHEIISALSKIDGLRVAASTSSFSFRDAIDVRAVGAALNVSAVLEGSVRRAGDRLRVTAQLVDTRDGFRIWSEVYDRGTADVFRVQEEIARAIVTELEMQLLGEEDTQLVDPGTRDIVAYDLYWRGRHVLEQQTPASARDAIALFEEALKIDAQYARAWAGLADAWILLREVGNLPLFQATQNSHDAISRALKIDNALPEAQASLGLCILGGGEYSQAARQFQLAIDLDPDYVEGYVLRANLLRERGYLAQATRVYTQALALDPLNPAILEHQAILYALQGRFDLATELLESVRLENPQRYTCELAGARVAALAGDYESALRHAERASELVPESPIALAAQVVGNARLNRVAEASSILETMRQIAPDNETVGDTTLRYHLMTGDYQALDALARARGEGIVSAAGFEGTSILFDRSLWMATAQLGLGDAGAARRLLETALPDPTQLDPNPRAVRALALLTRARTLEGDEVAAADSAAAAQKLADRALAEGRGGNELHYALATVAAARGTFGEALVHLSDAINAGWHNVALAKHDPALAALVGTAEYRALIDRL